MFIRIILPECNHPSQVSLLKKCRDKNNAINTILNHRDNASSKGEKERRMLQSISSYLGVSQLITLFASIGVQMNEVGITFEMLCVYCVIVKSTWKV